MSIDEDSTAPFFGQRARGVRSVAIILLIDDEPDMLATSQALLSLEGFAVVTARGAAEALQQIEEFEPDLIITDRMMPGMSGLDLCRVLRTGGGTRHIPIILHTAVAPPNIEPQLYDYILVKPAEVDALTSAVRTTLSAAHVAHRPG